VVSEKGQALGFGGLVGARNPRSRISVWPDVREVRGVHFGWCERVFIGVLILCWGSLPGPALAEDSTGAATRVVANYRIDLDNFNLGSFRFTTSLNGSDYQVRGDGHFSILGGLLYDLRTSTTSSGKVTSAGPEPAMYVLSYAGGGDAGQLRMSFDAGAVTELSIVPKQTRDPREIPITREQLVGVLDPIAAAFFHARSDDPDGDLKICDQTVPVFDGAWRFDLVLSPKRKIAVRKAASTAYSRYAVVCRVKFKPISGYAPDDPNIKLMSHTDAIEVWLVSLRGTDMYVPYRLLLPTDAGLLSATSISLRAEGNRRANPP
jgi:hypothetical protein